MMRNPGKDLKTVKAFVALFRDSLQDVMRKYFVSIAIVFNSKFFSARLIFPIL